MYFVSRNCGFCLFVCFCFCLSMMVQLVIPALERQEHQDQKFMDILKAWWVQTHGQPGLQEKYLSPLYKWKWTIGVSTVVQNHWCEVDSLMANGYHIWSFFLPFQMQTTILFFPLNILIVQLRLTEILGEKFQYVYVSHLVSQMLSYYI